MAEAKSRFVGPVGGVFVLYEEVDTLHPHHEESSHTDHGLTFLLEGWFHMEHGQAVKAEAGSITIVPAGIPHRPLAGAQLKYWLLGFCPSCLGLDESHRLMSVFRRVRGGNTPVVDIPEAKRAWLLQLYEHLYEECYLSRPESPEIVRALLLLLLVEIDRSMPMFEAPRGQNTTVTAALEYIQQHCLQPISPKDVAAAVHKTPAHLTASLKKATGYSLGQWITAGRVAEAASRLLHTDQGLDEIAEAVGWQDKTHLIRQFKKAFQMTPAAYRRVHQAVHSSEDR